MYRHGATPIFSSGYPKNKAHTLMRKGATLFSWLAVIISRNSWQRWRLRTCSHCWAEFLWGCHKNRTQGYSSWMHSTEGQVFQKYERIPTTLSLQEYVTQEQVWHPSISQLQLERMTLKQSLEINLMDWSKHIMPKLWKCFPDCNNTTYKRGIYIRVSLLPGGLAGWTIAALLGLLTIDTV